MTATAAAVPAIGYSALVERIKRGDGMAHVPLEGSWELTYRCNLTCTHCWVNLPAGDRRARQRELSPDEIDRIAGEIVDAGGLWLLLTGGEIFIRPDFLDIYRRLKRRGLLLTLYTNGTMITERAADLLAEYPPSLVEVSLYGITPGTYAAVTEVPALERCLRGIELLRERRIKIRLKSVVTTANYDEFLDIAAWVKREFGQRFRYDPNINFRKIEGREGMAPARVRVPAAKVVALDRALDAETDDLRETYQDMVDKTRQGVDTGRGQYVFECGAGLNSYHIDPYGRLTSCMMVPSIGHDLREGSFREGWDSFLERVVYLKKTRTTRCDSCAISGNCTSCPGWSLLEHGDLEEPVDYICDVNHGRAEAFGAGELIRTIRMKGAQAHG